MQDTEIHHRQTILRIPSDDLETLKNREYISAMEAELLIKKYKVWEKPQTQEHELVYFDYGVDFDPFVEAEPHDNATKFRIVGVTEEWIPIDGKVTKVLHIQLVNHW